VKIKKVFKKDRALELIVKGNNLVYKEPNYKKPYLVVFCFQDTDKLEKDLSEIDAREKLEINK
jgi:hypothetical protein